jgi:hypothetical protein
MTDFMSKFNFGGFLADTELPEEDMKKFYQNKKEDFDFLASEHIKEIEKLMVKNNV